MEIPHGDGRQKRFFIGFGFTILLFGAANIISYYVRSDILTANDAIHRLGFPFLISETGGYAYRNQFYHIALWMNIAIAFCTSCSIGIVISTLRK